MSTPGGRERRDRLVVAVDGPGGAGKGSVCRAVAARFGWSYLDTGALYRAVALLAAREGVTDPSGLAALAAALPLAFRRLPAGDGWGAFLGEEDVTLALRHEAVGEAASRVSVLPAVREALLTLQRRYGLPGHLILDGRDVGTVVWPDADLKIFLTADLVVRAERRVKELHGRGETASLAEVCAALAERDRRDVERAVAPLLPGVGAVVVETSRLTLDQSIERVVGLVADLAKSW